MNNHKGFAAMTAILIVLGIIVVGAGGYVAMNPEVLQAPAAEEATQQESETTEETQQTGDQDGKSSIAWRFSSSGEIAGIPQTSVTAVINGQAHAIGIFEGSCSEIGATGGVDGTGLLAGELSAAQCWFAGGGNEIGVFAHEDGGFDIMVGELSEGADGTGIFRGDFEVKSTFPL